MERAAHHPIGDGPPCYIDQNWRGKNGEQCKLEDFQAVLDKDNDAYGRCKRNALGKAVVDNLEALQYFSKGYPREKVTYTDPESSSKRTGVCEWPCANHFKLHPAVTGQNVPVRLRVGNAPRTDLGMRRDGYVLENPVTGTMVGCEYATSTGNKDYLNYGSFGELEWFVEGSERRVVGSFLDFWPGGSQELWNFNKSDNERRCSCIWGKLAADGPARQCKTGKGLACRPEDVRFRMYDLSGSAGLRSCDGSSGGGMMLLAEDKNGDLVERGCSNSNTYDGTMSACTASGSGGWAACDQYKMDNCGRGGSWDFDENYSSLVGHPNYGYGNGEYWEDGHSRVPPPGIFLGDVYKEYSCDRGLCDEAIKHALVRKPIDASLQKDVEEECSAKTEDSGKGIMGLPMPQACFRGALGGVAIKGWKALEEVQSARLTWKGAIDSYEIQAGFCARLQYDLQKLRDRQSAFRDQMVAWRDAKAGADEAAWAAASFWGSMPPGLGTVTKGIEGYMLHIGKELELKMGEARDAYDTFMQEYAAEENLARCFAEAEKIKTNFDSLEAEIVKRSTDAVAAGQEMESLKESTKRAFEEGNAALKAEAARKLPSFAFSYWYEEKVEAFGKEFAWAKRLVYLAMRAVEYEFQESLGLRKLILTATHPDQLKEALRGLAAEVGTRAINRSRPQEASAVLSLRDDVLGLPDRSREISEGERNASPIAWLRSQLWRDEYSLRDRNGKWVGQGVPFSLGPKMSSQFLDRCAERIWRVTATIQGDALSDTEPGTAIKILKKNTFRSQWCSGKGDGNPMQVGHLQPSRSLFKVENGEGGKGEEDNYSVAAVYPWFNVRRGDFYKTTYQDGASEELAGRGLYGDYILLFPAEMLEGREVPVPPGEELRAPYVIKKFPLNNVEDVLIRFDYLSVDNFAARGVQPNP